MFALYDTKEKCIVEANKSFVWSTPQRAKVGYNSYVRRRSDSVTFSKQSRYTVVEIAEVVFKGSLPT